MVRYEVLAHPARHLGLRRSKQDCLFQQENILKQLNDKKIDIYIKAIYLSNGHTFPFIITIIRLRPDYVHMS